MVAVQKLGRIDGLTRAAVMPHWYTTAQWLNQFPENTHIDTQQTLKSIKANSTPHDDLRYCPNWLGQKKGPPKKNKRKMSIADSVQQSAKKKRRTTAATKMPEEQRVDLEGKDVKDGQEGKT